MKKSVFIQLSKENENAVRYFAVGSYDKDNKFSGMVHGYEGGGEFSDAFIYKDKFLPSRICSDYIDWEEHVELMDVLVRKNIFEELDSEIRNYADFDTEMLSWFVCDNKMNLFKDKVFSCNMNTNPPSYGLTTWEDTKAKTWTIEEIEKELNQKSFENSKKISVKIPFFEYKFVLGEGLVKVSTK